MLRKILSLSLVAVMLSVTAFASADVAVFTAAYAAEANEASVFSYAANEIDYVTETTSADTAKHEPVEALPAWDGTAAVTPDQDENGTYLISSAEELAGFASFVNQLVYSYTENTAGTGAYDYDEESQTYVANAEGTGAYDRKNTYPNVGANAKLDRDINMSGKNWASFAIGGMGTNNYSTVTNGYTGDFDGQGHNIYNFNYSSDSSINKHGLFRAVDSGGSIKNLNMLDVEVYFGTGASYGSIAGSVVCGTIVGEYATSEKQPNVKDLTNISNVYVSGKAGLLSSKPKCNTYGSIAGFVKNATIQNCISDVDVDFTAMNATFPQTYKTTASVSGSSIGIGGVVGLFVHGQCYGAIRNCGNTGDIDAPKNRRVGGVVGQVGNEYDQMVAIENLWNTGAVTGYGQVAGVAGFVYKTTSTTSPFRNCYNTGDITASQATNAYVAGVFTSPAAVTTGGYYYSTGDVKIAVTDATTGEVTESFDATCGLIAAGAANTTTNQLYRSDLKTKYTADTTTGTGKTIEEIKAMTAADIEAVLGTGFVADCGINGGLPVLAAQKATIVLDEKTYEVANGKSLTVKVDAAGYVALQVTAIIEGTTLTATPKDGEAYNVTVSETGIVMLPTNGATEITVSAADGNRFLVKEVTDLSLANLEATAIKATIASAESATIVLALYNTAEETLESVVYAPNTVVADGKISAVIDLTAEDVAGCELRAYVWANGTLMPISAGAEVLN